MQQINLSASVNIIRDKERDFNYILTKNSSFVFNEIIKLSENGIRSFNIVGSYGTGKSAFLLALNQHFRQINNKPIFEKDNYITQKIDSFEFISIVGESRSFIDVFSETIGSEATNKSIFAKLKNYQQKLVEQNSFCFILLDEFGKFLEFATRHNPSKELYFLQEVAEFFNDPDKNFIFISTVHQNFDAYALSESEKRDWEKVKGRFKELTFNEPVEQLLHLASDFIVSTSKKQVVEADLVLLEAIDNSRIFRFQTTLDPQFIQKIYPFDLVAAMALTVALQRYGQNERSLFNFLTTDEHLGLNHFISNAQDDRYLHLPWIYDYLTFNFSSNITSKQNPDFFKWLSLRNALERVYSQFNHNVPELLKIVKTIGLIEILGSDGAVVDTDFLVVYGQKSLAIDNVPSLISKLEDHKIIIYQTFKRRFKLFEGTDENLEQLIEQEKLKIDLSGDISGELEKYFNDRYYIAKAVSYKTGTPRVFQVKITNAYITEFKDKNNEIDGYVNLIFNKNPLLPTQITEEPILYGIYKDVESLRTILVDVIATQNAISYVTKKNDSVAKEELTQWLGAHLDTLNDAINDKLFKQSDNIEWYYNGQSISINSKKSLNKVLSDISEDIYHGTPHYRNELINKSNFSNNIHLARKEYLTALFEQPFSTDFGFKDKQMPPEKMIYFTLCKHTGIYNTDGEVFSCGVPTNTTFNKLWRTSVGFLDSAQNAKRPLSELIDLLLDKPFRLKKGFIDFWILTFIRAFREDIAIYKNNIYIPKVGADVAELFLKEAANFQVKKFNIQGVRLPLFNKYRLLTKQSSEDTIKVSTFQETAKPFITFYKKLPKYTQQTKHISLDGVAFVRSMRQATDLEKLFFEDLPIAFGLNLDTLNRSEEALNDFIKRVEMCIAELRQVYDNLVERIENHILGDLGIEKIAIQQYLEVIRQRYAGIREYLLHTRQKAFLSRLRVPLEERDVWINSLAQLLMNKQLNDFTDEEVNVFLVRLSDSFKELDDLVQFSTIKFNNEKEQAFTVEIISSDNTRIKKNTIISKKQEEEVKKVSKKIKKILEDVSPSVYDAVLIHLLKKNKNDKS